MNNLLPLFLLTLLVVLSGCADEEGKALTGPNSGPASFHISPITMKIVPSGETRSYQIQTSDKSAPAIFATVPKVDWLSIDSNGLITTTPTVADEGSYSFEVTATINGETQRSNLVNVTVKPVNADITTDFQNAPDITVEDVIIPITNTHYDSMHMVPNADGLSWDILLVYMKEYGGPNEIVIIDTGTNEIQHIKQSDYMQWHMAGSVIAPDGNLYIANIVRPDLTTALNVYNPVTNALELNAIPLPATLGGETNPIVLGTDGKIYISSAGSDSRAQIVRREKDLENALPEYKQYKKVVGMFAPKLNTGKQSASATTA